MNKKNSMSDIEKTARKSIRARRILPLAFLTPIYVCLFITIFHYLFDGEWIIALGILLLSSPLPLVFLWIDRWMRGFVVDVIPRDGNCFLFRLYNGKEHTVDVSQIKRVASTSDFHVFTLQDNRKLFFYRRYGFGFFKVINHPAVKDMDK